MKIFVLMFLLSFMHVVYASSFGRTDVDVLLMIVEDLHSPSKVFERSWIGQDPCQDWFGISCLEGLIKSITFINMNLTGMISPHFGDISSVIAIDLSHNGLTGTIPEEIIMLKSLRILDVSYNDLSGKAPHSDTAIIHFEGNVRIRQPDSPRERIKNLLWLFVGFAVCFVAVTVLGLGFYLVKKSRRAKGSLSEPTTHEQPESCGNLDVESCSIPIDILRAATDDFSADNIIGRGGFGTVYKGLMIDGTSVAVKRMFPGGRGFDQLKSEVNILSKVQHRNLVILYGYCVEGTERILVYQYMPQGTLSRHLFHWKDQGLRPLEWSTRLSIALDVARGLEYLHSLARHNQSYIHRDMKPSNILLGDDMRARVSDFGFVRSTNMDKESIKTKLVGTFGYISPEYTLTGRVTRKVDVYSFGVILMELITGQIAIDENRTEDGPHIALWFRKRVTEKDSFSELIDNTMDLEDETRCKIYTVAELAGHCCAPEPEQRPEMSHIVCVLTSLTEHWQPNEIEEENAEDETVSEIVRGWQRHDQDGDSDGITIV